jgi:O-antigen ligase
MDIERPPKTENGQTSHRHPQVPRWSPIVVVLAPAFGIALWHGGFTRGGQLAIAAIAVAGVAGFRPRPQAVDVALVGGLTAVGFANLASLAWNRGDSSTAAALVATAIPLLVALGASARPALLRGLPLIVLALGLATATAGLAGLALRSPPLAERIAGVWRAGGTFEYPPALGLFCVCALAFALALHAAGRLDRTTAIVSGAVLTAAAVATFDRVAWLETVAVLALFAGRVPALRRAIWPVAAAAATCALLALAVSHPSRSALERHLRHGALSTRTGVWHAAWDAALRRPALGYGPGQFHQIYAAPASDVPPVADRVGLAHDAVLEQAVEAGLIAAAGTALALLAMLVAGVPALSSRDPGRIAFGASATAVALSGLYDFTWSFPPLVLLGALAALAAGAEQP